MLPTSHLELIDVQQHTKAEGKARLRLVDEREEIMLEGLGVGGLLKGLVRVLRAVGRGVLKQAKDPKMITGGDWLEDALSESRPMTTAMLSA